MTRNRFILIGVLLAFALLIGCQQGVPPPPTPTPTPIPTPIVVIEPVAAFAKGAFPPPIPDREWHNNAWLITDCLACHGKDTPGEAPKLVHKDLPDIYLTVNCRTCHVPKPPE